MDPNKSETNIKAAADALVARAAVAAAVFSQYDQEQVDRIVAAVARAGTARHIELARMAVEETGMGVFEDKVIKNLFATESVYNDIRDVKTVGIIGDNPATGIMEFAEPLGVILGITPITNPTSTVMFKCMIALKTRNAIVFSASRNALKCSNEAARVMYDAAVAAGAPDDVIRWVEDPSREMTQALMTHPDVALILATGGMGLVQAAYGSGKPAIGVGPGNVPVYIDKSANIDMAVNDILMSKTFDNGMICASEQAVVVHQDICKAVEARFVSQGAYFLKPAEVAAVQDIVIDPAKQSMSSKVVGKNARQIAELAGITIPPNTRLLLARLAGVGEKTPLSREKLCPVLGYYVAEDLDEGINLCTSLTHFGGLGHSVSIFSQDPVAIEKFSRNLNAGRILVNSPSSFGGIGDVYNRLRPSLTLGCGTGGRNITTDNVTVTHLLNIKRVSKRMVNMKWFCVPPSIYFEPGCLDVFFTHEIKDMGVKRAVIVCSESAMREGITDRVAGYLKAAGIQSSVFSDVKSDPTVETIEAGVAMLNKDRPDLIIALGGGSPIDAAKAMWLMYEHPEFSFDDLRLRFMDIRKRVVKFPALGKKARLIAIPTTSGAGSEVTAFTFLTDSKTGKKYPIVDAAIIPNVAIIDPNLVLTVPASVTADTGLDVLAHALESYVSVAASDYTDPLALKAIQLVFEYLPAAHRDGSDKLAREKMHNASTIAGMAFTNALLGINHCLAHILGATFHIPHGRANAFVMIPVIRYNAALPNKFPSYPNYTSPKGKDRYLEIAAALKLDTSTPEKGIDALVSAVAQLKKTLGVPASLREAGVPEAEFKAKLNFMAETAFDDQCAGANPSYPLVTDLVKLLEESYG
ncbi:MAG: bifunctional acetaldehyde-CoA/alcohol dehydrogenase [Verrucomicrobia bacterium]|nr:bifunctional acetaldehyde-CoA/alcohol dehydrogenase [Verrucomicrobiota bacterium]MBU4290136.1 bifunctional acetaldehyde-CoA/alcohol dehydrogenase [Verrucomicrobiota bacterium]MBU4428094.1 bifunctional acetaldehyde-CoA/alcohol dehydrogenase [Verrucomicrobiota bacterium]MCG2681460.1 bifunctional acetaldehyde-CoA/alcohol dehydrogenase [Kiritimatiellia bacterium]